MKKSELKQLIRETIEEVSKNNNQRFFNDPLLGQGSTFVMAGDIIVGEYIINAAENIVSIYNYITDQEDDIHMGAAPTTERIFKVLRHDVEDKFHELAYQLSNRMKPYNETKKILNKEFTTLSPSGASAITKDSPPKKARKSKE